MEKIKILLINDFRLLRESLAALLHQHTGFEVVGQTGNMEEARQLATELSPQVILLDLNLQPLALSKIARQLRKIDRRMRLIVFTANATHALSLRLVRMPTAGYITKESSTSELIDAIVTVHHQQRFLSQDVQQAARHPVNGSKLHLLTKREGEVVAHIRKGLRSRDIAECMDIAIKTVEIHRYNILRKLEVKNTAALVNYVNRYT